MPATTLQLALRDALGARVREAPLASVPARFDTGAWDDAAALAALNGEQAHVDALRKLFLDELPDRSEEHTSELQSLMRISYAVFCLKKKKKPHTKTISSYTTKINNKN